MAYGTPEDRERAARLAAASNQSVSQWIITTIREKYLDVFGEYEVLPDPQIRSLTTEVRK